MSGGECRVDVNSIKRKRKIDEASSSPMIQKETQTSTSGYVIKPKDILGVIEDKELLDELEIGKVDEEIEETNTSGSLESKDKPLAKIQRVPEIMQQNESFKKYYYKPREFSVGPLHARSSNLLKKELKVKLASRFVKNSGNTGEDLLGEIKRNVNELKGYFDEEAIESFDDESLARLLFLDGCSVLQFICSYMSDGLKDFKINSGQAALIQQDLLLVENQVPFRVLKLLMDWCDTLIRKVLRNNVLRFIITNAPVGYSNYMQDLYDLLDEKNRVHLLELLRAVLLFGGESANEELYDNEKYNSIFLEYSPHKHNWLCFPCFRNKKPSFRHNNTAILRKTYRDGELYPSTKRSFRNVQELKLAGVKLKPSSSSNLRAISFTTRWFINGELKLPTLAVDSSTAPKLLNLVAYEMGLPDYNSNCSVTSYVNFLDLLIDSEQDVRDLRAAHILTNRLSSDAEVAKLFNNIGNNCLTAPRDTYLSVKNKIQCHYERHCAIWMAQVYKEQFSSPWTIIALLAAAIALVLTAIQTWYAVNPEEKN